MPLSKVDGELDILNRIREIPGVDVIEGEYTPDSWKPTVDAQKMFKPYILIKYNGGFPAYDNGICGPEKDTQRVSFSVFVVSATDRDARGLRDQVEEKLLTNFRPTDGSSLQPKGSYSFIDADLGYHRYVHNASYTYMSNLS